MQLSAPRTKISSRLLDRRRAFDLPLIAVLLAGLALRLLLWGQIPRTGLISDEGEYLSAASWLVHGHGFDWYQGYLWTRAPLYPLFLALHLRLFGDALAPIYATQTLLSLLNVALVYFLARRLVGDDRPPTTDHRNCRIAESQNRRIAEARSEKREARSEKREARADEQRPSSFSILHSSFFIPSLAALLMALYLPFAIYPQVLLSETLFITLLLGGFLALARWAADHRPPTAEAPPHLVILSSCHLVKEYWPLASAGVLFGLATLTRSITLLFLPVIALWLLLRPPTTDRRPPTTDTADDAQLRSPVASRQSPVSFGGSAAQRFSGSRFSVLGSLCFVLCSLLVILPWTVYNSRMYGGLVLVDTSGAFNLLLGGRTAYDGDRNDAATRDYVLALLGQRQAAGLTRTPCAGLPTPSSQAAQQGAMTREALCLIAARPAAFATKSLVELIDLFQINYTGAERFSGGFTTGRLPPWYALSLFLLDDTLYVLVLPLAVIGWALARRLTTDDGAQRSVVGGRWSVVGLWLLYNIALAPLLFAINRFRLPLLPFAFIFAAYAIAALARGGWRRLRTRRGVVWVALASVLAIVATAPYAYLWPESESLPSYLGPYPSSLASTIMALEERTSYLRTEQLRQALRASKVDEARRILASGPIQIARVNQKAADAPALIAALLDGRDGRPADGLDALPPLDAIVRAKDVEAAVVRGDLLRSLGRLDEARVALGRSDPRNPTGFVDDANPVQWAWDWLHPAPLPNNHLDLAGDLDLGYIAGCFLGEGDQRAQGTFRWCSDGAQLRFPAAGTGAPQTLVLRADGRGWLSGWLPVPPVRVELGDQQAGAFTPSHDDVGEYTVTLPPTPPGADVVVTLRTPTFIPDAARYLSQQGAQVGQAQRLGVRLDWAELRNEE
jgi:hypothetical protein